MWQVWQPLKLLLDHLFPSTCLACGRRVVRSELGPFCLDCLKKAEEIRPGPRCLRCGINLAETRYGCLRCHDQRATLDGLFVLCDYISPFKEMIHHVKFEGNRRMALWMGHLLSRVDLPQTDAIVPVPLSKNRLIRRGFNQSHLIAEVVSRKKHIPLFCDMLIKVREVPPQSLLSGRQRRKNPIGAYRASGRTVPSVVLVDDVYTTGATINECARVLKDSGVNKVYGLVFAKATGD